MESKIYSVSSLNKYIKMVFDKDNFLSNLSIKGEITNFKSYASGHLYFTLKDETSSIKCVMFKGYASAVNFKLTDGISVVISGQVSSYERDGVYQLYAKSIKQEGIGDLYTQYEQLKEKLKLEGLFDEKHKKKIPFIPSRVGIITSPSGAVIKDIINVSMRRYDRVNLLIYPSMVQGNTAAETIVEGIKELNKEVHKLDVIIIARGGGSFEDLFCFNDEKLARQIFKSKLPIISAVGHETDFTICDFVSDLRVPTPSAAAEIVYPSKLELSSKLDMVSSRLKRSILVLLDRKTSQLEIFKKQRLEKTLTDKIEWASQSIDMLSSRLKRSILVLLDRKTAQLEVIQKQKLEKTLTDKIEWAIQNIDIVTSKIKNSIEKKIEYIKQSTFKQIALLDSYSPLKTLTRGYSTVQNKEGKVISKIKDVKINDELIIRVIDGKINAVVTDS